MCKWKHTKKKLIPNVHQDQKKNKFLNGILRAMQRLLVTDGSHKIEGQSMFQ